MYRGKGLISFVIKQAWIVDLTFEKVLFKLHTKSLASYLFHILTRNIDIRIRNGLFKTDRKICSLHPYELFSYLPIQHKIILLLPHQFIPSLNFRHYKKLH